MADLISDGMIRVYHVPTIANKAAPTVAELNAGTRLDTVMTPDGWGVEASTAEVDNSSLSSTYDTRSAGRRSFGGSITVKRQAGSDAVFSTLVYQATGFLVKRDAKAAGDAWAAGDKVEVYPVQYGERNRQSGPNTVQRYSVPVFVTDDAATGATVAA